MTTWRLESMWTRTLSTTISINSSSMVGLSHGRRGRRLGGSTATPAPAPGPHRHGHDDPEGEATDVREEGDPATDLVDAERGEAVDELEDDPEGQHDDRRHVDELVEEAKEHKRCDARVGVQHEVRAEGRGDGAG